MALVGDLSGSDGKTSIVGVTGSIDLTYDGEGTEDGWIQLREMTGNPGTPSSDQGKFFIKDNGSGTTVPYFIDSGGTVTSMIAGGSASPEGSDSYVQYNNGGSFGGASGLVYDDTNGRVGIGTVSPSQVLSVYGDVSGDYITTIDNDQSSAGHVLKLSTDGNGSGTRVLEMEDGDGDIIFRARADGRFGFGPDGVGSMGAGTFVVGIDNSSHTSDIAISQRLQHLGDGNTYLDFPSNDTFNLVAGGNSFLKYDGNILINNANADVDTKIMADDGNVVLHVDAGTNKVGIGTTSPDYALDVAGDIGVDEYIYHNGDADTFIRFQADDITVKAGNVSFINITEDDSQDKISFNEGRADVDFIVRSPDESLALYLNAGNEVFHINHGESGFKTKIHSTNGEAITVDGAGVVLNEDAAAANDFRVESDNKTHMFFVDAGNEKIGINTSAPDKDLEINNSSGGAIRLTYNDANGSASNYADISVGANGALTLATVDGDGVAGDLTLDADGDIILDAAGNNVYFDASGTRVMSIMNISSDVYLQPTVSSKDLCLATQDDNVVATVDSSDGAFRINRKLGLTVNTLMNSSGALSAIAPMNKIVNTSGSDITGALPNPTFEGQVQIVLGVAADAGAGVADCIVTYLNALGTATTKTLSNGIAITLVGFDATGSGTYRWCPVGDVS